MPPCTSQAGVGVTHLWGQRGGDKSEGGGGDISPGGGGNILTGQGVGIQVGGGGNASKGKPELRSVRILYRSTWRPFQGQQSNKYKLKFLHP